MNQNDMLEELDKGDDDTTDMVEPSEGERSLLSSNKSVSRSPSLDFTPNPSLVPPEVLVDQLAAILVEAFLLNKVHERNAKEGSDLLPGVDKGTS